MGQITNNAIGWVQFRVAGGIKSTSLLAVAYAMVMVGVCALIVMVNRGRTGTLDNMPVVFLALQGILAGAVTMFRVANAINRDMNAKLMESHRLMPIDPRLAVLGYAAGGGLTIGPIALVNLLFGAIATSHAGMPMTWWLWANGVLLSWCVFAWCIAAGGTMLGAGVGALILMFLLITFVTGGAVMMVVPGMASLASPLADRTIFRVTDVQSEELVRWVICMVLELPVAWVMVLAGARRFRLGGVPGLTGPLGSALVAAMALASIVAMRDTTMLPQHIRRQVSIEGQLTGTLILLTVLGTLTAVSHVARHTVEFPGRYRGWNLFVRDAGVVLAIIAAAAVFLLAVPDLPHGWPQRTLWSISEAALVIVTVLVWARWLSGRGSPAVTGIAVIGAWWILPLLAGTALNSTDPWRDSAARAALQISPLGMYAAIWDSSGNPAALPSLLTQLIVPALGTVLLLKGRRVEALVVGPQGPASEMTNTQAPMSNE